MGGWEKRKGDIDQSENKNKRAEKQKYLNNSVPLNRNIEPVRQSGMKLQLDEEHDKGNANTTAKKLMSNFIT